MIMNTINKFRQQMGVLDYIIVGLMVAVPVIPTNFMLFVDYLIGML